MSPGRAGDAETTGVKSSERTLDILEHLSASGRRTSIADLSRALGIPKSSLHGLIRTMAARGWLAVDRTGALYGLGLRAVTAGTAYLDDDDAVGAAASALDRLAAATGETVHLGRLDGAHVVYLAKRESPHPLRLFSAVGRRLPAHATALGKVLLARLPDAEVDERLPRPLERLTDATITDRVALRDELQSIRERGYAVDRGENASGIACIAVGLLGRPVDAISCSGPSSRMTAQSLQRIRISIEEAVRLVAPA